MISGTGIAQALLLLATPLLTRLYSPSQFGALGFFVTIVGVISVVSCGRYEFAILIPRKDEEAANLLILALGLCLITISVIVCSVLLFKDFFILFLNFPKANEFVWFIAGSVLFTGFFQTFNYWCTRKKEFRRVAISRLFQSVITIGSQIVFAVSLDTLDTGLISGYILGQFAAASVLGLFIWREEKVFIFKSVKLSKILLQAKLQKKFPLFNSWPSILDSLRGAMPIMFLTSYYGVTVTGYYSLAMRVLWLPSSLLGASISQVLFQRIADENNKTGKPAILVEKSFQGLSLIAIPYLILMLFSPFFFDIIFGSEWNRTGLYALILSPATALMFIVSPLSVTTSACNRQEVSAGWQLSAIILTGISLSISMTMNTAGGSLVFLCINNLLLYTVYAYLIFKVANADFRRVLRIR